MNLAQANIKLIMNNANRVVSDGQAVVDGCMTGLAGCSESHSCRLAENCLRASVALTYRVPMAHGLACLRFIPA